MESFISTYNALRVFAGFRKVFFSSTSRPALVSECNLLATVKVTRETNFSKGNFVVRTWSDSTDKVGAVFLVWFGGVFLGFFAYEFLKKLIVFH